MNELRFFKKDFEDEVRRSLQVYDRPLTEKDALFLYGLDCSNFTFNFEDCDTLCMFKNLDRLDINIGFEDLSFLTKLQNLEVLGIEFYRDNFDCAYLLPLKKLEIVFISGGDISGFKFHNFEALTKLPNLKDIGLHEFGAVDLSALKDMLHLKAFFCGWADKVNNIEAISNLVHLEHLRLIDVTIPNLDFMRSLPNEMALELCGVNILDSVDLEELKRFKECDLDEIEINGERVV